MKYTFQNIIKYISEKFPGPFLNYMRNRIETSELRNASLYEIAKVAYSAKTLDDLYKSIHHNIKKLMYADNMYIAIHDKKKDLITVRSKFCQNI